jgi:putative heme-binding domain-containing protein
VVADFQPALAMAGERRRGAEIVRQSCLACHVLHGHGQRVGPDLASAAGKDPQALLTDILDPSRQVTPDHVAHELVAKDGRAWTGLVASETATRVTLRFPGSPDVSVPVSGVASLRSTGRSLMPDGLEAGLDHADMASLLAFLRKPDPAWLGP